MNGPAFPLARSDAAVARLFAASQEAAPPWLVPLRRAGAAAWLQSGPPGRGNEAWRYTSLAHLDLHTFHPPPPGAKPAPSRREAWGESVLAFHLRDGRLVEGPGGPLPWGLSLAGLGDDDPPAWLRQSLGRILSGRGLPFVALNTALAEDALCLRLRPGLRLEPVILVTSEGEGRDAVFHPRLLVVLEKGASATVVEWHRGVGRYLSTMTAEFALAEGATLHHYKIQEDSEAAIHLAATGISLARQAGYRGAVLQLGGRVARHEVQAGLDGPESDLVLDGASLGFGRQMQDNTSVVVHRAAHGRSRQAFRSVLGGRARGVFQGRVRVAPTAGGTDAHQSAQALLLSPQAVMDAKPELEIDNDDVRCGHGAAIGALDEEALFYLRSRGLDAREARHLMIEGFLAQSLEGIKAPSWRELFLERLRARLDGEGLQGEERL